MSRDLPMAQTPYQRHKARWSEGCGDAMCSRVAEAGGRVCLLRGKVPCDVLFIGEAPGKSENVLGQPFVGPAGQLLDRIVKDSIGQINVMQGVRQRPPLRVAFTNLVGCIPMGDDGDKVGEPEEEQIVSCAGRLRDVVKLTAPRLIVCVGKLPETFLDPGYKHSLPIPREVPRIAIQHPAAILRAPTAGQGLMIQRAVVRVRHAAEKLVG